MPGPMPSRVEAAVLEGGLQLLDRRPHLLGFNTTVEQHHLERVRYVLSPTLGISYQVGKLPYAVLLDAAGVILAKGLVNTREHLESLFEARDRGVASIQDFLRRAERGMGVAQS